MENEYAILWAQKAIQAGVVTAATVAAHDVSGWLVEKLLWVGAVIIDTIHKDSPGRKAFSGEKAPKQITPDIVKKLFCMTNPSRRDIDALFQ